MTTPQQPQWPDGWPTAQPAQPMQLPPNFFFPPAAGDSPPPTAGPAPTAAPTAAGPASASPADGGGAAGAGAAVPPPDPGATEVDDLMPQPDIIELTSGTKVRVRKMKTRELLGLIAIGLAGIGPRIADLRLDMKDAPEVFLAKFAGLIFSALPHAQDEALAFLRMVVDPVGLVTEGRIDRAVRDRNNALKASLDAELENPEVDDTITIIQAVAIANAGDMQAWGKRLAGAWNLAQRTGQIPAFPKSPASTA